MWAAGWARLGFLSGWADLGPMQKPEQPGSLPAVFFLRIDPVLPTCLGLGGRDGFQAGIQASLVARRGVRMQNALLDALVEG